MKNEMVIFFFLVQFNVVTILVVHQVKCEGIIGGVYPLLKYRSLSFFATVC